VYEKARESEKEKQNVINHTSETVCLGHSLTEHARGIKKEERGNRTRKTAAARSSAV
jgi:hypothetical protein